MTDTTPSTVSTAVSIPVSIPVSIAVVGAGRVGSALGRRWAAAGHRVAYGVRDPADPKHAALSAAPVTVAEACASADVVLIALPWNAVEPTLAGLDLGDAVVIDATNPLASNAFQLAQHPDLSGAELIAGWSGSTRVIKAFNTTGAANMADPAYPAGVPAMLVAGDDDAAKQIVLGLAGEIGFDALDAGPLPAARDLEHLAMLWIRMAYPLGNGPDIAFSLLRR